MPILAQWILLKKHLTYLSQWWTAYVGILKINKNQALFYANHAKKCGINMRCVDYVNWQGINNLKNYIIHIDQNSYITFNGTFGGFDWEVWLKKEEKKCVNTSTKNMESAWRPGNPNQ